jgi:hypothetical protein
MDLNPQSSVVDHCNFKGDGKADDWAAMHREIDNVEVARRDPMLCRGPKVDSVHQNS